MIGAMFGHNVGLKISLMCHRDTHTSQISKKLLRRGTVTFCSRFEATRPRCIPKQLVSMSTINKIFEFNNESSQEKSRSKQEVQALDQHETEHQQSVFLQKSKTKCKLNKLEALN